MGLRTLSPQDSRYRPRYEGGPMERDSAYHQGTVWPFLLGPFVTAWLKTFGDTAETRTEARSFLKGIEAHLQEACLGQVSEIFDGDSPHQPRGCPAQAWSVAEPLRALVEDLGVPMTTGPARSSRRNRQSSGARPNCTAPTASCSLDSVLGIRSLSRGERIGEDETMMALVHARTEMVGWSLLQW